MASFLRTHALTLLMVVLAAVGTGWAVRTLKPPGAMTVLEAQAMDMTAMQAPPGAMPVAVETLQPGKPQLTLTVRGLVELRDTEDVVAVQAGRVREVAVRPGQRVERGALLLRLEPAAVEAEVPFHEARPAVESARLQVERARVALALRNADLPPLRAALQAAESRLRNAERDRERAATLVSQGALPKDDLQDADAALTEAERELGVRRGALERATAEVRRAAGGVDAAVRELAKVQAQAEAARAAAAASMQGSTVEVKATRAGQVAQVLVQRGDVVLPGEPLAELRGQDRARVRARLAADSVAHLKVGSAATVAGRPARVSRLISPVAAGDGQATVDLEVTGGEGLVPGDLVEVQVPLRAPLQALSVPRGAVHRDLEGRDFVWLVADAPRGQAAAWVCPMHPDVREAQAGDCPACQMALVPESLSGGPQARKQVVEPGEPQGDRVVLRSGLSEGRVVTRGAADLREGMPVVIVPWGPLGPENMDAVR